MELPGGWAAGGSFLATSPSETDSTFLWGSQAQLRTHIKVHRKVTKRGSDKDVLASIPANPEHRVTGRWGLAGRQHTLLEGSFPES